MTPRKKDKKQFPDDYPPFDFSWETVGTELPEVDKPGSSRFGKFLLFLAAGGAIIIVALLTFLKDIAIELISRPRDTPTLITAATITEMPTSSPPSASTLFPPTDTPTPLPPAVTSSPTPQLDAPQVEALSLSITLPPDGSLVACPPGMPCQFDIAGTSSGVYEDLSLVIWTLVYPTRPVGQGWYLQRSVVPESSGEWLQGVNFLGEAGRLKGGEVFNLVTIAAATDASYEGVLLAQLPVGAAIPELRLIEGLAVQSDPVAITVLLATPTP